MEIKFKPYSSKSCEHCRARRVKCKPVGDSCRSCVVRKLKCSYQPQQETGHLPIILYKQDWESQVITFDSNKAPESPSLGEPTGTVSMDNQIFMEHENEMLGTASRVKEAVLSNLMTRQVELSQYEKSTIEDVITNSPDEFLGVIEMALSFISSLDFYSFRFLINTIYSYNLFTNAELESKDGTFGLRNELAVSYYSEAVEYLKFTNHNDTFLIPIIRLLDHVKKIADSLILNKYKAVS